MTAMVTGDAGKLPAGTVIGPTRRTATAGTNPLESVPSSLSAFRFATFASELTIIGGRELWVEAEGQSRTSRRCCW